MIVESTGIVYIYFISFSFVDNNGYHGFGNTEVSSDDKITSIEDLDNFSGAIETKNNFKSVIILNYQLLRTE
jgi:hypothetical protein